MSLAFLSTLGLAFVANAVKAQTILIEAPYYWRDYDYEYRTSVKGQGDSGWQSVGEDFPGIDFDFETFNSTGYRISGDDTSAVLFRKVEGTGSPWAVSSINQGTGGIDMSFEPTVHVTYSSGPEEKRDFWNDANPTDPLYFSGSVNLHRTGCEAVDFKLDLTYENGTEYFSIEEPLDVQQFGVGVYDFPLNGELSFADGSNVTFTLYGIEDLLYEVANGERAPYIYGTFDYNIEYCP